MKKSFEFIIDDSWAAEFRSAQDWGIRNFLGNLYTYGFYALILGFVANIVLLWMQVFEPLLSIVVVISLAFIAWTIWYWYSAMKNWREWDEYFREHTGDPIKWRMDNQEFELEYPGGKTTTQWSELSSIECYATTWNLTFANLSSLLPVQFIDHELEDFLKNLVSSQSVKVFKRGFLFAEETEMPPVNG